MEYLLRTIRIFGRLKVIFFHDGPKTSSSLQRKTFPSSNCINKSLPSSTTGSQTGVSAECTIPLSRTASLLPSPASMSDSVPLGIPTRYGSTTESSYGSIDSHDYDTSNNIDDDDFDFYPSIPRRDGIDLGDPEEFPISFKYIPLVTKPAKSEVVRPPRHKVVLHKRRRHAPDLRVPTPIPERPSIDGQSLDQ
jgi:hypothetical protein